MSAEAFTHEAASATNEHLAILLLDHPGADILICSQDSYHFRVPKISIVNTSPILGELIRRTLDSPDDHLNRTLNPEIASGGAVTRKRRHPSLPSHFPLSSTPTHTTDS